MRHVDMAERPPHFVQQTLSHARARALQIPIQPLASEPYELEEAYPVDANAKAAPTQFVTLSWLARAGRSNTRAAPAAHCERIDTLASHSERLSMSACTLSV
jgi:hypothetical protein